MPFQGNQGRGAIDPNVLSFLLNSQNQRAQNQRMMAKDAFDAQIAQAKFQAEMQAKAREEQRKEELHRETIRTKTLANQATENELYGKASTLLENQSPENARAGYATAASRLSGGNNDVANAITGGPEDQQFLSVVNGLAPGTFDQDAAQLDDAAMFAQLQQVDPALAQALQQAGQQRGLSSAQQIQSGVAQNRLGQIGEQQALETKRKETQQTSDIQMARERQLAIEADRRAVTRFGREISALTDQITEQEKILATTPPGSPAFDRAQKMKARLELGMTKQLSENVDPRHFEHAAQWQDETIALMQNAESAVKSLESIKQLALDNPTFLGSTSGGLTEFVSGLVEGTTDIANVTNLPVADQLANVVGSARDAFLSDPSLSPEQRDKLGRTPGFEGILQARTDIRALESSVAYLITRGQNPGRFALQQYQDNLDRYSLTKGTAASAMRRLNTSLSVLQNIGKQAQIRLGVYSNTLPGAQGGLVTPGGQTIIPPGEATNYQSLSGQPTQLTPAPQRSLSSGPPQMNPIQTPPPTQTPEERAAELRKLLGNP